MMNLKDLNMNKKKQLMKKISWISNLQIKLKK